MEEFSKIMVFKYTEEEYNRDKKLKTLEILKKEKIFFSDSPKFIKIITYNTNRIFNTDGSSWCILALRMGSIEFQINLNL